MGSRRSSTTSHPARCRAARCSTLGWPPVTIPGRGSHALGTPAMASSSWLIRTSGATLRRNVARSREHGFLAYPVVAQAPRPASKAVGELGRRVLDGAPRSEEHTSELQSRPHLVCRLLLEKKKKRA